MRLGARLGAVVSAQAPMGPMASSQGRAKAVPTPLSTVRREIRSLIFGPFHVACEMGHSSQFRSPRPKNDSRFGPAPPQSRRYYLYRNTLDHDRQRRSAFFP